MFEKLNEKVGQAKEVFSGMTATRKIMVLGGLAAIIAGFIVVMVWVNATDYSVLYSGLDQNDAGAIINKLNERKTPYKLENNGSTISVPREVVQETRLFLATEGLPAGGAVGMEVFDESKLGETDFVQRLKYQRALQGELERTIARFPEVDQVRIHLNIPKESLFIEDARKPSASVMLQLKPGKILSRSQLAGIVHLVSSSVEGLEAENISVVDSSGGLLYAKDETDGAVLTESQLQQQRALEQRMSLTITSMLERIVGPDKALARVSANLNFQQIATNEEVYDPDRTAIRSEQRLAERSQGPARGAEGAPTATYELGTGQRQEGDGEPTGEVYEKTEDTTNYEITKINRQVVTPGGDVERLSVAVMVDGTYTLSEKDGETVRTYVPRPQSELAQLEELVRNAIGYDENRGDSVVVTSVPFYMPEEPTGAAKWWSLIQEYVKLFGRQFFNIILIVLFFLFFVRPVLSWLRTEAAPEAPEMEALPEGEVHEALPEPSVPVKGKLTRDQVLALAQQNPERTINLVRAWIEDRG